MGDVIPFPHRPLPSTPVVFPTQDKCEDIVHVFTEVPGLCQCGEHRWDPPDIPTEIIGIIPATDLA